MSDFRKRAEELRSMEGRHYNCAQGVLIPFAEAAGVEHETAYGLASCFGSGMNMGSVCGAVTGGLMALGLCGKGDRKTCQGFLSRIRENHAGSLDCRDLLRKNAELGLPQKMHCDGMVYEAIQEVEEILRETAT